jgi:hypothetical protein
MVVVKVRQGVDAVEQSLSGVSQQVSGKSLVSQRNIQTNLLLTGERWARENKSNQITNKKHHQHDGVFYLSSKLSTGYT